MNSPESTPQDAFLGVLVAAMLDAATEGKLTQLQATILPQGSNKSKLVRIIVIPEEMEYQWPKHAPLGTPVEGN